MRRHAAGVSLVVLMLLLTGCASGERGGGTGGGGTGSGGSTGRARTLTVLAAASLTESFSRIGADVESAHPGTSVVFSFAGSAALAQQIVYGAPADVFAAASPETMARVTKSGEAAEPPRVFARNRIVIAVPRGNPGEVRRLADLADEQRTIALCAPQVPCGAAAARLLAAAGVSARPDTLESDVRATLAKVRLGEVDAALVYYTDVVAAGDAVTGIEVDAAGIGAGDTAGTAGTAGTADTARTLRSDTDYLITVLRGARETTAAQAFVEAVLSPRGRAALRDAGFTLP